MNFQPPEEDDPRDDDQRQQEADAMTHDTTSAAQRDLPPLPESHGWEPSAKCYLYTEAMMRAYALDALAARESQPAGEGSVEIDERVREIYVAQGPRGLMSALRAALAAAPKAAAAPEGEPDMRKVCEALGFDPTNHHNALKCPYCRPADSPPGWKRTPNGWERTYTDDWETKIADALFIYRLKNGPRSTLDLLQSTQTGTALELNDMALAISRGSPDKAARDFAHDVGCYLMSDQTGAALEAQERDAALNEIRQMIRSYEHVQEAVRPTMLAEIMERIAALSAGGRGGKP